MAALGTWPIDTICFKRCILGILPDMASTLWMWCHTQQFSLKFHLMLQTPVGGWRKAAYEAAAGPGAGRCMVSQSRYQPVAVIQSWTLEKDFSKQQEKILVELMYWQNLKLCLLRNKIVEKLVTSNIASAHNQCFLKDSVFWLAQMTCT